MTNTKYPFTSSIGFKGKVAAVCTAQPVMNLFIAGVQTLIKADVSDTTPREKDISNGLWELIVVGHQCEEGVQKLENNLESNVLQ